MNEKQTHELIILIESFGRNMAVNDVPGAACVRAEIHRRLAAAAAAPEPMPVDAAHAEAPGNEH